MSGKKIVLAILLVDFVAVALWGVSQVGFVGLFAGMLASPAAIVNSVDLVIALGLVMAWIVLDARARGTSPLPYLILTIALGSVGPLLYLLRRPEETSVEERGQLAVARAS